VVNVTHDGDDGGTNLKIVVGLVFKLLLEVDVEGFEKLLVFLFGADNQNLEPQLLTENLERGLIERLRCRCHLTEVEENGHQVAGTGVDLVSEVRDGGTTTQTDDRRAIATGNADATQRRGFAQFKLGPFRTLRLTCFALAASATKRTSGSTTGATATATSATSRGAVGTKTGTSCSGSTCGTTSTGTGKAGTSATSTTGALE
jgi:hypothetical protein